MLTGKPPFDGQPPSVVLSRHIHEPLPDPRSFHPAVPEPCVWLINKATHKDPTQRYQTAGELAEALATLTELLGRAGGLTAEPACFATSNVSVIGPATTGFNSPDGVSSGAVSGSSLFGGSFSAHGPGMVDPSVPTLLAHNSVNNSTSPLGVAPGPTPGLGRCLPSTGQLLGRCVLKDPLAADAWRRPQFLALHIPQNRLVRLTLLTVQGNNHRQRIARQAQSLLNLQHPNLVSLVDFHLDPPWEHLAYEWVNAASLADTVARCGNVPPRTGLSILAGVCRAAGFCHAHGVVHGNIHAGNVLLQPDGSVKVADLGVDEFDPSSDSSSPGNVAAFAKLKGFMAPERQHLAPVDHRTDVFSLGAVLFFALVGRPPAPVGVPPSNSVSNLATSLSVAAELDSWAANALPADDPIYLELRSLIVRAMAEDPAYRFQSVSELLEAIRRLRKNWPAIRY